MSKENKVLFLDLETTGLIPQQCSILEVTAVVVDGEFNILGGYSSVVRTDADLMKSEMNDWCKKTHFASGLFEDCINANKTLRDVENDLLALVSQHFNNKVMLAGNSISFDRSFIDQHLPNFASRLDFHILDVSSIMAAFRIFGGMKFYRHKAAHRTVGDISDCIKILKEMLGFLEPSQFDPNSSRIQVTLKR